MNFKTFISFNIENIDFVILKSRLLNIEKNKNINKNKIFDLHSLFGNNFNNKKYFVLSSKLSEKDFIISKSLKIIHVENDKIKFYSKIHPYISGILIHKNKLHFIISLTNIIASNYKNLRFDLDYLYKILNSNAVKSLFTKISEAEEIKDAKQTFTESDSINKKSIVEEKQDEIQNKKNIDKKGIIEEKQVKKAEIKKSQQKKQTIAESDSVDEKRKKEIYEEIEKIIESIKIKDYDSRAKKSLKKVKSFFSKIILLYVGLISTTSIAFGIIYANSIKEKNKIITEVTASGTLESIIIKELQRKQQQEKKELESQLKNVQSQLEKIKAEKENFLKNQDKILKEKEKQLYEEYQKKLERQKALLAQQGISEEEYNKRIEQINQEYNLQKQKVSKEIQKVKDEYLKKLSQKETQLKDQASKFQQELNKKAIEISKIQKEKEKLSEKIKASEAKQKELSEEIKKMQALADEKIRISGLLNKYYGTIYNYLKNKKYNKASIELDKLNNLLYNSKEILVLSKEEITNNRLMATQLEQTINFYKTQNENTIQKNNTFQKANIYFKNKQYSKALEYYSQAFTKFAVITGKEEKALLNLLEIKPFTLENKSKKLLDNINTNILNKEYELALIQIQQFLAENSELPSYHKLIDLKNELSLKIKQNNIDKIVEKKYNVAFEIFKLGQLQNAKDKLFKLLTEYPDSSYTKEIVSLLLSIDNELKKAKPKETKKAITEETIKTIGRVLQTFGNYILFSTEQNIDLKVNDVIKVYTLTKNIYKYIGSIKIIDFSNGFGKGVIIYKEEDIKIGDYLSKD